MSRRAILVSVMLSLVLSAAGPTALVARAGQPLPDYLDVDGFLLQTPAVTGGVVSAFANPAALATNDRPGFAFWWDDRSVRSDHLDDYGFSMGKNLGFSMNSRMIPWEERSRRVTDYQIGLGLGDRRKTFGVAYRWSTGGPHALRPERAIVTGTITRPTRWLSFGSSGAFSLESGSSVGIVDVGIRPLGREWLTFFGDYTLRSGRKIGDGRLGFGVEVRPIHGVHLGVKFREDASSSRDLDYAFQFGVTLSGLGLHVLPGWDADGRRARTTYLLRGSPPNRSLPVDLERILPHRMRYVPVNLENKRLTYRKYRIGDKRRVAWLDLLAYLDAVEKQQGIQGVALNLDGFSTRPSLAWELRRKLAELREGGKEILVYADRLSLITYYLASVADRIVLDPEGEILLPGLAVKRTYLKGTLDKLGLGFQEFRYLSHKTAAETYSRDSMSEADREQLGRLVDVIYETVRDGVCARRGLTAQAFDSLVDEDALLDAGLARKRGLVDDLGRWPDLRDWLKDERDGAILQPLPPDALRRYYDEPWGTPPRVAVVYALGECAMDTGIRGRATSRALRKLADDPTVRAVVLRVDSPGGDVLPSDLVAQAVRKLRDAGKPVIVSQGDVAASGGYWISMNGTRILTTPMTITGSIGVIGGWVWDDGLHEKTGVTADGVSRGKHADLLAGARYPLLGVVVPQRAMNQEELKLVRERILGAYDDFVGKVAAGRGMPEEKVRDLAEGRVWMGPDALQNGLCDAAGGLEDALREARRQAGIPPGREVELVEYPPRRLFEWPSFGPSLPGVFSWISPAARVLEGLRRSGEEAATSPATPSPDDYAVRYLRMTARHAGRPLAAVFPDVLPPGWDEAD